MDLLKVLSLEGLQQVIANLKTLLAGKVDKVDGKQLSTEDYTTAEKDKLGLIEDGAQVNVIEEIKVNGTAQTITDKGVDIDLSSYATKADITSVYKVKGSKPTVNDLPATDNVVGDVWNVEDTGSNYVWTGTEWDKLSETVDLSGYYNKGEVDGLLAGKVDKVEGMGLSENSFTTAEKDKLAGLTAVEAITNEEIDAIFA